MNVPFWQLFESPDNVNGSDVIALVKDGADAILDEKYGKSGTPEREEFNREAYAYCMGQMVMEARKQEKMSQSELAERVGTNKTYISRIERGGTRYMPFAFTELGVAMLSSVLRSETAIEVNRGIMRAFVAVRQMLSLPKRDELSELQADVKKLKDYVEDILTDQNDINEETTMRLELIEQSLAELQSKTRHTPHRRIGFKTDN